MSETTERDCVATGQADSRSRPLGGHPQVTLEDGEETFSSVGVQLNRHEQDVVDELESAGLDDDLLMQARPRAELDGQVAYESPGSQLFLRAAFAQDRSWIVDYHLSHAPDRSAHLCRPLNLVLL